MTAVWAVLLRRRLNRCGKIIWVHGSEIEVVLGPTGTMVLRTLACGYI
jgi:hypothetical protein